MKRKDRVMQKIKEGFQNKIYIASLETKFFLAFTVNTVIYNYTKNANEKARFFKQKFLKKSA